MGRKGKRSLRKQRRKGSFRKSRRTSPAFAFPRAGARSFRPFAHTSAPLLHSTKTHLATSPCRVCPHKFILSHLPLRYVKLISPTHCSKRVVISLKLYRQPLHLTSKTLLQKQIRPALFRILQNTCLSKKSKSHLLQTSSYRLHFGF